MKRYTKGILLTGLLFIGALILLGRMLMTETHSDEKRFPELSNYNTLLPSGELSITCEPLQVMELPESLKITVTNISEKTLSENNAAELERLEKKRAGGWYYAPNEKQEADAAERILPAGASRTDRYPLSEDLTPGEYRILYLYRGAWGAVEFEIL